MIRFCSNNDQTRLGSSPTSNYCLLATSYWLFTVHSSLTPVFRSKRTMEQENGRPPRAREQRNERPRKASSQPTGFQAFLTTKHYALVTVFLITNHYALNTVFLATNHCFLSCAHPFRDPLLPKKLCTPESLPDSNSLFGQRFY